MSHRTSVALARAEIEAIRERIASNGWATVEQQTKLYENCADDACVVSLLQWLCKEIGMPISHVVRCIKVRPGSAQPRHEALQMARQGRYWLNTSQLVRLTPAVSTTA